MLFVPTFPVTRDSMKLPNGGTAAILGYPVTHVRLSASAGVANTQVQTTVAITCFSMLGLLGVGKESVAGVFLSSFDSRVVAEVGS